MDLKTKQKEKESKITNNIICLINNARKQALNRFSNLVPLSTIIRYRKLLRKNTWSKGYSLTLIQLLKVLNKIM